MPAATFATVHKDLTASSVHTPTALGNEDDPEKANKTGLSVAYLQKRRLHPHDDRTAKSPFLYDVNALGSLRPDQVPRFFGALTDADKLPDAEVSLDSLIAMQDRVDPAKVEAIRHAGASGKKAVVVRHNGKHYIADGHHRLTADWLNGANNAQVKLKDLESVDNALKRAPDAEPVNFRIAKVDEGLGLVFGWAIVCKVNGQDYYDLNIDHDGPHKGQRVPEHITEKAMTEGALGLVEQGAPGNEMHGGPDRGYYPFLFPMTTEIAKAMGVTTEKTGLMCAFKPPADVLQKFKDGTYTGFSIEGRRGPFVELA